MSRSHIVAMILAGVGLASAQAHAAIVISEVDAAGSSSAYGADWFEVTNTGSATQDITGWKMDDSSNSFATSVALRGVSSIAPGQSVVFLETGTDASVDSTFFANFESAWFGSDVPSNFVIGAYGGSGVGLSASGDGVNLFDSAGNPITGVSFSASTAGHTFDNAAGLTGAISTASEVGTNGAFTSQTTNEVGSPGRIAASAATPEPASLALLSLGGLTMLRRRRAK